MRKYSKGTGAQDGGIPLDTGTAKPAGSRIWPVVLEERFLRRTRRFRNAIGEAQKRDSLLGRTP
jgi:hypothetical protein